MVTFASEEFIDSPPERIFPYIAEPKHHAEWMDVIEVHAVDGQPAHLGSRFSNLISKGPMKFTVEYEIKELEPNRRFGYRSTGGRILWDGGFTITPEGSGSRVASSGTMELRGVLRLLSPLIAGEVRSGEAKELKRLKQLIEREA